jgi:hypothetical protein
VRGGARRAEGGIRRLEEIGEFILKGGAGSKRWQKGAERSTVHLMTSTPQQTYLI